MTWIDVGRVDPFGNLLLVAIGVGRRHVNQRFQSLALVTHVQHPLGPFFLSPKNISLNRPQLNAFKSEDNGLRELMTQLCAVVVTFDVDLHRPLELLVEFQSGRRVEDDGHVVSHLLQVGG